MRKYLVVLGLAWVASSIAYSAPSATEIQYHLSIQDMVRLAVQGEPDVSVERRVDGLGCVNVPLIGNVKVSGLTIAEAQDRVAQRYIDKEIFIKPEVVISVIDYAPKYVMVLGQVGRQGKVPFPSESASLSIVEAITNAGGLTRIGKGDAVRVTRRDADDKEQSFTINVEKLLQGNADGRDAFQLLPGDVVFVPERVF